MSNSTVVQAGIYRNIKFEKYLEWDACSNSRLSDIRQSPAHCRYRIDHPEEPTESQRIGNIIDCAVLTPFQFESRFIVADQCEATTKAGKRCTNAGKVQQQDGWKCLVHVNDKDGVAVGMEVISKDDYLLANAVQQSVYAHRAASVLLKAAQDFQLSACWIDPHTELRCKIRPDAVAPSIGTLIDLKSTTDASPVKFENDLYRFGYHRQSFFYLNGFEQFDEGRFDHFAFIVVEKDPPFAVAVYRLNDEALAYAKRETLQLMDLYKKCRDEDRWPAYSEDVQQIGLPRWAEAQSERLELEREMNS